MNKNMVPARVWLRDSSRSTSGISGARPQPAEHIEKKYAHDEPDGPESKPKAAPVAGRRAGLRLFVHSHSVWPKQAIGQILIPSGARFQLQVFFLPPLSRLDTVMRMCHHSCNSVASSAAAKPPGETR